MNEKARHVHRATVCNWWSVSARPPKDCHAIGRAEIAFTVKVFAGTPGTPLSSPLSSYSTSLAVYRLQPYGSRRSLPAEQAGDQIPAGLSECIGQLDIPLLRHQALRAT